MDVVAGGASSEERGGASSSSHGKRTAPQVGELGAELDRRGSEDAARADTPLAEFLPRIADLF